MSRQIVLRPEAESDIIASHGWYARQGGELGADFVDAIDELLTRIASSPELFAVSFRTVRRAKTRRFPYIVYFRLRDERIEVIAVLHASRDPRVWRRRV